MGIRYNYFLVLFLINTFISVAQIKGTVIDNTTKQPIPYVNIWVEGEDTGTTADENGAFSITADPSKKIYLNVLGYTPAYVNIADIKDIIAMMPQIVQLEEVIVTNHKTGKKRLLINPLKKLKKVDTHYSGSTYRMLARHIPYKPEYAHTPYLHTLRFPTQKYRKHFMFNLRLYSVGEDGAPGEPIYPDNIIVNIPANKKEVSVDVSTLNIRMPEDGMFIVAEKYLIKQNISGTVYEKVLDENNKLIPEKDRKYLYDLFGPVFICEQTVTNDDGWVYYKEGWHKGYHIQVVAPPEKTHLRGIFAVEITLSD